MLASKQQPHTPRLLPTLSLGALGRGFASERRLTTMRSDLSADARDSQLNIGTGANGAFSQFVAAAINSSGPVAPFDPYTDNLHFLFAAYIMEDVVPTGWEVR